MEDNQWTLSRSYVMEEGLFHLCNSFYILVEPGPKVDLKSCSTELECFKLFFDSQLLNTIIKESEEYIRSKYNIKKEDNYNYYTKSSVPYMFLKYGITVKDLYTFIAIRMRMGINRLPNIKLYWSKDPFSMINSFPTQ